MKERYFETGAKRDSHDLPDGTPKGRCDLLPAYSVREVLKQNTDIPNGNAQEHMLAAVSLIMEYRMNLEMPSICKAALEALIAVGLDESNDFAGANITDPMACAAMGLVKTSIHYQEGADHYGENNWKLGQPCSVLIDSGTRHALKAIAGNNDENHFRATAWNLLSLIWTIHNKPELMNLPIKE